MSALAHEIFGLIGSPDRRDGCQDSLPDFLVTLPVVAAEIFFYKTHRFADNYRYGMRPDFSSFRPCLKRAKDSNRNNGYKRLCDDHSNSGSGLLNISVQGPGALGKDNGSVSLL